MSYYLLEMIKNNLFIPPSKMDIPSPFHNRKGEGVGIFTYADNLSYNAIRDTLFSQ